VSGAYTYAVGPNPGPAPQFRVPSISATAVTPPLLIVRWLMFLGVMSAAGLLAFRLLIARALVRRVEGVSLRALDGAFVVATVVGLIATPVYLDFSTANDSLRSVFDLGALVPLFRVTAFGRAILDLELCFALFSLAGWVALAIDRPQRERRSIAELAALTGAGLAAVAVMVVPGAAGHAAQTSPRGLTLGFDWLHLLAGSVWLGGLIGLLVLWLRVSGARRVSALGFVVPRFSSVAFGSVVLVGLTGIGEAIDHMPAVNALWETSYGVAILVKTGLLGAAMLIASGNLLRTKPRLAAAGGSVGAAAAGGAVGSAGAGGSRGSAGAGGAGPGSDLAASAARLLRTLVSGEVVVVAGAIFTAAVLSSLAPPPPAFSLENSAVAHVGPGRVAQTVRRSGYVVQVLVSPNKAAAPDAFGLHVTRNGQPVRGANVTLTLNHLEMEMPQQEYQLKETTPGVYTRSAPALVMVGKWGLAFAVTPRTGPPLNALIVDEANG
jgi:copper transport protein